MKIFKKFIFIPLILLSAGCAIPGKTFVSIIWREGDKPDAGFLISATAIPSDIDQVDNGVFYQVAPGTYNLIYAYSSGQMYNWSFTIEADAPILGKEYAYYDIWLHRGSVPTMYKFPTDHFP